MKRRIVSVLTALALMLSLCPTWVFAVEGEPDTGLCDHHREHTTDCGYTAPTEGQPCSHEHGDECYSEETVCCHNHGELCYSDGQIPAEGEDKAADTCTHVCSAESGCVTRTLDCQHVHNEECGYVQTDPGTLCGYECRICPIEALIDTLPNKVTEENRADVEARLQEILALFAELPADQLDITPCLTLQEQLDAASAASPLVDEITLNSRITINSSNRSQYDNKVITGTTITNHLTIDGVTVSLTIKDLSLLLEHSDTDTGLTHAGIALRNNATLHLTLEGTNKIKGGNGFAAISVPEGCTLEITSASTGSLEANGGSGGAGIGSDWAHTVSSIQTLGSIEINGGNISARGNAGAAGIGGTYSCMTGSITITGGTVYAEGSSFENNGVPYGGAGIGGGYYGYVPTINITGGTVTAKAGCDTAACIGAGTDGHFLTGDTLEYRCGNISITGGTVTTDGEVAVGHNLNDATGSITLSTDATLNINNGGVRPMPAGWNSYSMNGRVFDTSITSGQIAAGLLIDGRTYDVTIKQDTSQPYCGIFSLKILLPETSSIEVGLLLGGKTLAKTVSLSDTTVDVTFGTQDYQRYSISGTIYDGRITGDMRASVTFLDESCEVTLKKTSDYCATFSINNLTAMSADIAGEIPVTVTADGITWSGTASGDTTKNLTIGRQLYKTRLIFWDGGIKGDMPVSQIQVSRNGVVLGAVEVGSDNILHMEQGGRGYVDVWMVPGEDTSISVTVPSLNGGQAIQKDGITIESNNNEFEMYRGVSTDTPTLDIANGDVIFGETDGSLSVTYWEGGEEKTTAGLSYEALHVVTQSNNTSAVANRIIVRDIKKSLYLQIKGVNLNREGQADGAPISIEANCTVELQTKGSNTVVSNSQDPAVYVAPTATLTLSGNGELNAKYTRTFDYCAAAIGGKYDESSGKIIIRSGRVVATKTKSSSGGAGIGGGQNGAGDVEIHGGIVEASTGDGAGIGGGNYGNGTVKIYGGTVTVTNNSLGTYGAGIGGGRYSAGTVDIYGSSVNVVSTGNMGAGIGGGESGSGTVRIYGGNVNVVSTDNRGAGIGGGFNSPGTVEISGGTVTAKSSGEACRGAAIGGGENENGNVTISGGEVSAVIETSAAAIGGGRGSTTKDQGGGADITISGGVINASAGYGPAIGSGGGYGVSSKDAVVTISGGTITTSYSQQSGGTDTNIQIGARSKGTATVTITGGSICTQGANHISSPTNGSENGNKSVSLVTITLPSGAVPADTPLTSAEGYGVHDVYPLDGNKFYFYLPANTLPETITVGGVDYEPQSAGNPNYVVAFHVEFNNYSLTKVYDGTPMQKPTAEQVTSNGGNLTFAWYQGNAAIDAPVNAGSYTLRVFSSDKGSKDFTVEITKRPLTITAEDQSIDYGTAISQTAYTTSTLAAGDAVGSIFLAVSQTALGTHTGAITVSSVTITRNGADVTGNYDITKNPGTLTIRKAAPTVSSWPTASEIAYGQALNNSTLTGGDTNGTFSWADGAVKPGAGHHSYAVVFTPTDSNYDTVSKEVSVTVNQAVLTISARDQTITYGRSIQTGAAQVTPSGLVNGDTVTGIQLSAAGTDAGTYQGGITVTGAKIGKGSTDVTANYAISYAAGILTINPAAITITPNSGQKKEYGAADPVLTYTAVPSLIGNDKFTGALTYEGVDTGAVGQHKITLGSLSAGGNYTLTLTGDVMFEITKLSLATAVVTLDAASFTYDGTAKAPAITVKKGISIVDPSEYDISYSNSNGGSGNRTNAGTVTVTVTAKESGNYTGSCSTTFTIGKKELTPAITGTATTKTFDGTTAAPAGLSITLEGKAGNDDVTATATSYAYDSPNVRDATKITASGITLSGAAKDNYVLSADTAEIAGRITKDTSATAPAAGEGYTLDYAQETLTIKEGYEVNTASDGSGSAVSEGSISAHLGTTLYIRKTEDDNHAASDWTAFILAARPDAPSLTKTDETLKGQKNGSLSGITTAMEYSVDGGKTWIACLGTSLENLSGGTAVQVCVKATASAPCGAVSSHTIAEGKPITATFDSQGGSSIGARTGLTYGSKVEKPADPAREDYEFQGWFKETACTTAWNFDSDILTAENVTLYAKWKKVRFTVGGTVKDSDGKGTVSGAAVTLMKGSEQIDQGTTGDDGGFTFSKHIPAGAYNIVTTYTPEGKARQIKTTLITLLDQDMTDIAVTLPPEGANSQLAVSKSGDTPAVVVGGLDDEAAALKTGDVFTVTVSMEVEGKKEAQVDKSVVEAIKTEVKTESGADDPVVEYLDIIVTKQVNSGSKEEVTQTTQVIEIVVPFSFDGRTNVVVVRYHGATAQKLTPAGNGEKKDGTYRTDEANGYLYIYTNQFSTYAVGYTASYTITFDANGGTLTGTAKITTGSKGTLSGLPATPSREGYTFKGWYTAASGGTQITTSTVFKADATVYAQWQQNSSGGNTSTGGGWSSVTTYAITTEKSEHGKVASDRINAGSGSTVTLTVTPDNGYVLDTLTVTDSRGGEIKLTAQGNGKYTFTMPGRAVTVKATFAPLPNGTACDGGEGCPSRGFTDLGTVGTWYHEAVDYILRNDLMGGYGNGLFRPNDTLSRAQFAQILFNKEGRPVVNYLLRYNDVADGAWYTEAIRWATSQGVVSGYGNGMFGPNDNITREQLAVMLWRYAGSPAATEKELHFTDADKASGYALEALRWAVENGVMGGYGDGRLDPKGLATRAQVAQMLKNYLEK